MVLTPSATRSFRHISPIRAGTRYQRGLADAHLRDFGDGLHGCGEGLADGGLFEREVIGDAIELVGTHHHVSGERAVDAMAHAAARRTEDETALTASSGIRRR